MDLITRNPLYDLKIKSLDELGLKPKYIVGRKDEKNKHTYTINGGETWFVGVSSILDILSKPQLIPWAAKEGALRTALLTKKLRDKFAKSLFKPGVWEMDQRRVYDLYWDLLSDKRIDRVTNWGKRAWTKIKDSAADIGTRAHEAIDNMIKGKPVLITPDIELPVQGFLHWLSQTNLTIASGDIKVASVEEEYGGSIDAVFVDPKDQIVIGDFKTSKQFSDSYVYQVALYSNAFSETYGLERLAPGFIIRFDKIKPEVEIRGIRYMNEAWKGAQALRWAHRLLNIDYWDDIQRWTYKNSTKKQKKTKSEEK